jgi:hypothetical protein
MPIVQVVTNGVPQNVSFDKEINECPVCHRAIEPISFGQIVATSVWLDRPFKCPSAQCQRLFISQYKFHSSTNGMPNYEYQRSVPVNPTAPNVPESVKNVSPDFVAIYTHAHAAEEAGLDLICGVGYRKSLEFLIKDYAMKLQPEHAETIKTSFLGICIRDYIKEERIQETAKRAAWLGNDETHYLRKWDGKDLQDLKKLIHLTVSWIDIEITTREFITSMPE